MASYLLLDTVDYYLRIYRPYVHLQTLLFGDIDNNGFSSSPLRHSIKPCIPFFVIEKASQCAMHKFNDFRDYHSMHTADTHRCVVEKLQPFT